MATQAQDITAQQTGREKLLLIAKLAFLHKQARHVFVATLAAALTVIPAYYHVADPVKLAGWLALFIATIALRYVLFRNKHPANMDEQQLKSALFQFQLGTFVGGLLWGLSCLLFVPFAAIDPQSQILYLGLGVLYASALSAGCMVSYAVFKSVWLCFAVPCMLPLMLVLALSNTLVLQMVAVLMAVYFLFLYNSAAHIHDTILESLLLRMDKADLAHYLKREEEQIYKLNQQLNEDIAGRAQVENDLRDAKGEAEALAAELMKLSSQDGLTGIANRRQFDQQLNSEWSRALRKDTSLGLIMCDIDHYKSFNDNFGHQAGDDCLKALATVLSDHARRAGELAARYGGEEFALILPDIGMRECVELAEQIRVAVLDLKIRQSDQSVAPYLSLSLGVTVAWPRQVNKESKLIQSADEALDSAKANGRNCIVTQWVARHLPDNLQELEAGLQELAAVNPHISITPAPPRNKTLKPGDLAN
ncbi:MAG: diguanylate cyclase [Gammaproteobacteria bacterium]